ncbi:MAG: hypothetical protein SVY53_05965 [Chloroflexota bacterium]|nr:hypothetical protein [Chloroflexota bacterium]
MLLTVYPCFRTASGWATGLPLSDIAVSILRVRKSDKAVTTMVDAAAVQAEIGKGCYAYYYDATELDTYDYLSFVDYVGTEDLTPLGAVQKLDVDVNTRATLGAGAMEWTYTLTEQGTGNPIPDATVWVTTDAGGSHVVASGLTNQEGIVTFWLDTGTVYVWRQKSGWNFSNPDEEVVS